MSEIPRYYLRGAYPEPESGERGAGLHGRHCLAEERWSLIKKLFWLALVAFALYYVLHSPRLAGDSLNSAGKGVWHAMAHVAASLTKFFDTLFS